MATVWKYGITNPNGTDVVMPRDAKVLSVGEQDGRVMLWVLVDPKAVQQMRRFYVYGTGHEFNDSYLEFVGTVFMGPFVWHVFEGVL